jgi:3-polyprenyl-4-hydroxybenzoate decarboxylase
METRIRSTRLPRLVVLLLVLGVLVSLSSSSSDEEEEAEEEEEEDEEEEAEEEQDAGEDVGAATASGVVGLAWARCRRLVLACCFRTVSELVEWMWQGALCLFSSATFGN